MADRRDSSSSFGYRLDDLGWLQFERVCSMLLAADVGDDRLRWSGHADRVRRAALDGPLGLASFDVRVEDAGVAAVCWAGESESQERRVESLVSRVADLDVGSGTVVVMTNLDEAVAARALPGAAAGSRAVIVGREAVSRALDRNAAVRAALPSVLGSRDMTGLISPGVRARSSLNVEGALELARVFWPTRAHAHARAVLTRYRFVVLTGPPEMGKTAIARMLALAQMSDGWEAHECAGPEQLSRVFDASRRQVFLADDAFGSTEYRPDAAERWARSLGRLLPALDREHWLIWTSRPAPLKAGLRRVQRERHSERFPAPGEVLVDASDLDLGEKTLILFRHAKARRLSVAARGLVRSSALTIVEHPHFTPERIRRLVSDRLDDLQRLAERDGIQGVRDGLQRELSTPTEAMRTSYRALGSEHRELLIALLDAPAGSVDERELAASLRRHHPGGLSRPPGLLIDRLTDHFLRVTPLGIGWVHPSWRDLVISELREARDARRRFLTACGLHGTMLALSREGGAIGERSLPLIVEDRDWDTLGDRVVTLAGRLEDQELGQLFLALIELRGIGISPPHVSEARNLTACVLTTTARRWDRERRVVPAALLEHWYTLREWAHHPVQPPSLTRTWAELHPASPSAQQIDRPALLELDEWLTLVHIIAAYEPERLAALGFPGRDQRMLVRLVPVVRRSADEDTASLAGSILGRIQDLVDGADAVVAHRALEEIGGDDRRWWVPEDIPAPPTRDPVSTHFTRDDVDRVLADL